MTDNLTKDMIPQLVSHFNQFGKAKIPLYFYHAYKKEIDKQIDRKYLIKGYQETVEIRSMEYSFKDFSYSDLVSTFTNSELLSKLIDEDIEGMPPEVLTIGPYRNMFKLCIATEVNSLMEIAKIDDFEEALLSISAFYIRDTAYKLLKEYNPKGERIK